MRGASAQACWTNPLGPRLPLSEHARCQCAGMLDHLRVLAYGEAAPLKSLASVAVREGQTLVVTAFDPQVRRLRLRALPRCCAESCMFPSLL